MINYPFLILEKRSGLMIGGGRVKERKFSDVRRADVGSVWKHHIPDSGLF